MPWLQEGLVIPRSRRCKPGVTRLVYPDVIVEDQENSVWYGWNVEIALRSRGKGKDAIRVTRCYCVSLG